MIKPTLIVMAAGLGSRYGGLKQVDPVGPAGEIIVDYSAYDAWKSGFGRIVFVIKEELETLFKERVANRIASAIPVDCVLQRLEDLPAGFSHNARRIKPWGTGHAIYCCREIVNEPFAVINADDFYGADAFAKVAGFLRETPEDSKHHACMIGYFVENTLTEHGSVARGVCDISENGYLNSVTERTRIARENGRIIDTDEAGSTIIAPGTVVSMNFWGYTPSIMHEFEPYLLRFLYENRNNLEKAEFYLPYFTDKLLKDGRVDVKVLKTGTKWYGVTYREDKAALTEAIKAKIKTGEYPEKLWDF